MPEKCQLVAYKRVSTKRQGQSGLGLEGQAEAIRAYAQSSGCRVVATYTEVESGKLSARPELAKAIAHARRSKAVLVVAKLDRLSRNVAFLSALMESKVDFVCCDNPHATPLTVHILAAVAEDESDRISKRTKAALEAYKARGGVLGTDNLTADGRARGSVAAGLALRRRAFDEVADLLPDMRAWRTGDGATLHQIARRLNGMGHVTRAGAPWSPMAVKRVLDRAEVLLPVAGNRPD